VSLTLPQTAEACAPVSGWRRALSDSALVAAATLFGHALGAVTSLLLRWLLEPTYMGIWQGLKLFLSYGNYAGLGVSKAAAREVSLAAGSGDAASARRAVNLGFTVNTLTSAAYAAVLLAAAGWLWWTDDGHSSLTPVWAAGLAIMAALAMLQRYVTYQVSILRAEQGFATSSWLNAQEAVLTLAVSAAAVWLWGVHGLFASAVIVLLASLAFLRGRACTPRLAWDWLEVRRLMWIGSPLLAAGVASSLFRSLDKLMILAYLDDGEFQLGCYSLALLLTTQMYGLANMLSAVMGPRYGELFGRTSDCREVARLAARATEPLAAALALPAALAIAAAPPVLEWLLPKYRPGLEPLLWLVPGTLAVTLALPASGYLVAVNRGRTVLAVLVVSILVTAIGNHLALRGGSGLRGVAAATLLGDVVYLLLMTGMSIWPRLERRERMRYLFTLGSAMLPILTLAAALNFASRSDVTSPLAAIAPAAVVITLWSTAVLIGWRAGGWRQHWKQ
jgi:O-antigen/teichoic acid export membrane protein